MFFLSCLLFVLAFAEPITRVPSRFFLNAGKSVIYDESKTLQMEDVHQFLEFLSAGQREQKRTFGRIGTSLIHRRRYSVMILMDADLKSNTASLPSSLSISSSNQQFMKFSRNVYHSSYTIAAAAVDEAAAHEVAPLVEATPVKDGILIDGIQFLTTVPSEARFIDDLRRITSLPKYYKELTSLRRGGNIELTLVSTYELPAEKQAVARALLLNLVKKAEETIAKENTAIFAIVFTDFSDRHTVVRTTYEHPTSMKLQDKPALVTARFNHPIRSDKHNAHMKTVLRSPAFRHPKKNDDEEPAQSSEIGAPAPVVGSATFHLFFWTIILLFVAFIVVSVLMWNMKTFEDPLIYFTEYVLDSDDTIMEESL